MNSMSTAGQTTDEIVSDHTGYVGASTQAEIRYAEQLGKPVQRWSR
jgi:hypothetical protein